MPHRPFTPWTEIAPTGSSMRRFFSTKKTDSTTRTPAIAPIRHAESELTKAHAAAIATRPARAPLHMIEGSGLLPRTFHIHRVVAIPPAAEASTVLTMLMPLRRSVPARLPPELSPNHPNARMKVPSITIGRLCGGIGLGVPSLLYFPRRGPSSLANQKAMTPPCRCTTEEPEKSQVP